LTYHKPLKESLGVATIGRKKMDKRKRSYGGRVVEAKQKKNNERYEEIPTEKMKNIYRCAN